MRIWRCVHTVGSLTANSIELTKQRGSCLSIAIKQNILEECSHQMEIIQTESGSMCLLNKKQNYLTEIISNKAIICIP